MYFTVNENELEALCGLTYLQQITYLRGIRPYMDRQSYMVGIKRRISYQSLAEALYIEPHQGIKESGSPSRQQVRRAIKGLERSGLVSIHSIEKQLILKCLIADNSYCVQNKPDTKPTHQPDTNQNNIKPIKPIDLENKNQKTNTSKIIKADTPHDLNNNFVLLSKCFESFWKLYPQKREQLKTWDIFKQIKPDELLFQQIMQSLQLQVEHHKKQISAGKWVPNWKNPANWLIQECWKDEVSTLTQQERKNDSSRKITRKQYTEDSFWVPDEPAEREEQSCGNIIAFNQHKIGKQAY